MLLKQRLVEPRLCWYNLMAVLLVLDMFHDFVAEVGAYFVVVMMMEHQSSIFSLPGLAMEILLHYSCFQHDEMVPWKEKEGGKAL